MHVLQPGFICLCAAANLCVAQSTAPVATIPLEPYLRAQAVVQATVSGQTGTFLFDTGVGVSNFTPAFMKKIDCRPWGRLTGFRMTGERLDVID